MNWKSTAALLVLAAVVGVWVWKGDTWAPATAPKGAPPDPPALAEPWYTKQIYKRLSNDDKSLRIRYWDCGENQNNTVTKTDTGSSDFTNFTFTKKDGK